MDGKALGQEALLDAIEDAKRVARQMRAMRRAEWLELRDAVGRDAHLDVMLDVQRWEGRRLGRVLDFDLDPFDLDPEQRQLVANAARPVDRVVERPGEPRRDHRLP